MKTRFILIIAMLIALFGAWLYLAYEGSHSQQAKLDDLSQLPVYTYVADTTKVAPILAELKPISTIASVVHETGVQASNELLKAYGLPLTEEMIADYSFPDIITINFKPCTQALQDKAMVLNILRTHIAEEDIDSQGSAYSNIEAELKLIVRRNIVFHVFTAIVLLLIFVFSRLSFELHILLLRQDKNYSVVDKIRHHKQGVQHTWTMLLIPLPLCIIAYYAHGYFRHFPFLIPYWVFIVQFASALIGTLITHFTLHTFDREAAYAAHPVKVISPNSEDTHETLDS